MKVLEIIFYLSLILFLLLLLFFIVKYVCINQLKSTKCGIVKRVKNYTNFFETGFNSEKDGYISFDRVVKVRIDERNDLEYEFVYLIGSKRKPHPTSTTLLFKKEDKKEIDKILLENIPNTKKYIRKRNFLESSKIWFIFASVLSGIATYGIYKQHYNPEPSIVRYGYASALIDGASRFSANQLIFFIVMVITICLFGAFFSYQKQISLTVIERIDYKFSLWKGYIKNENYEKKNNFDINGSNF